MNIRGRTVRQNSVRLEKWSVSSSDHLSVQQGSEKKHRVALGAHNKSCGCVIEMRNKALNASWHADLQPERTHTPISIMEWITNKQSQDITKNCVYVCEKKKVSW